MAVTSGIPEAPPAANAATTAGSPSPAQVFFTRVQENAKHALAQQRPWSELYDRNTFNKPENLTEATNRVKKNLAYFHVNYSLVLLAVIAFSMLMKPTAIFWLIALSCAWSYTFLVRTGPVVVWGRSLNDRELFVALTLLSVLVIFGLTSVGSILISGLMIGGFVVTAHAALKQPDDLFLDEQASGGGFLSWLAGPPSSNQLPNV
eukprot:TRINITY_DN14750_c0_g1_i1.p1 TRINITY_DN14750_c0_g1~~TRINITY_DN14750_c0_g1_i1.p1  ORF type:complete len:205 (-),score=22.93 TRINITY_DN14750_c0_g1_i1:532-1146(-)